jgi:hypothetical protein
MEDDKDMAGALAAMKTYCNLVAAASASYGQLATTSKQMQRVPFPHLLITPGVTDCGEFRLRVVPDRLGTLT